jgi:hypothetical protein
MLKYLCTVNGEAFSNKRIRRSRNKRDRTNKMRGKISVLANWTRFEGGREITTLPTSYLYVRVPLHCYTICHLTTLILNERRRKSRNRCDDGSYFQIWTLKNHLLDFHLRNVVLSLGQCTSVRWCANVGSNKTMPIISYNSPSCCCT